MPKDKVVPGTQGYTNSVQVFVDTSLKLSFQQLCKDFISYLSPIPARILDVGSGVGQNAAALAKMGYSVTAVEPLSEFFQVSQNLFNGYAIDWRQDHLPELVSLSDCVAGFEFILLEGVWHHLNPQERLLAIRSLSELLVEGGRCALSLRNGPAGLGTCIYPTDVQQTQRDFEQQGFDCLFRIENQPSILPQKAQVTWARIVFEKRKEFSSV